MKAADVGISVDTAVDVAKESALCRAGQLGVDCKGLFRQIRRAIDIFRGSAMIDRIETHSRCRVAACECSSGSLLWLAVEK